MGSILMVALGGFFIGGVYSFWRNGNKPIAVVLAVFALVCLGTALAWAR